MSESNGDLIRDAYQDFATGNILAAFAAFDTSITWHIPGHSPLSGVYDGPYQVGGFLQHTMDLSGGAFNIDLHHVLDDGDLVVPLVTVNAQRNGVAAAFPEIHVWRLKNGKGTEFREYQSDKWGNYSSVIERQEPAVRGGQISSVPGRTQRAAFYCIQQVGDNNANCWQSSTALRIGTSAGGEFK